VITARARARLGGEPLEQLVAQEPQLATPREAVARDLALPHELPEVLDVDLEQLGGHRRGQDRRELAGMSGHPSHDNATCRGTVTALRGADAA
jgi:hypothetical protein